MVKKNKTSISDAVYAKKTVKKENPFAAAKPSTARYLNPFEVHMNKEKFQILGRTCKHDKGLPGVSKAKANKKRRETLGVDYKEINKTNSFKDRRIGKFLSADQVDDEVMNARFLADKIEHLKERKQSRFNLNDDEVLTHRGQTLEDIEQFRDVRSDDEGDEEDERLDADFTEAAHFGGDSSGTAKDRKTAIEEMIIEQKKRKVEIAKEKDELFDLTEKLDANYKDLLGLVGKMTKNEAKKHEVDDYDRLTKELIFEPRGVVTDKLISEEEMAQKEKNRLEKLERERLKRMRADGDEADEKANNKPSHRSADDLDDGYFAYGDEEEQDNTLAYNLDGVLGTNHNEEYKSNKNSEQHGQDNEDDDEASDDEASDGEEEDDGEGDEDEDASDDCDDEEDALSDLKVTDSDEDESGSDTEENNVKPLEKNKKSVTDNKTKANKSAASAVNIERTDIPFTLEMPKSYEEFTKMLKEYAIKDQSIVIERLIKCNHPKLEGVNREKIVKLFAFILQILNEKFEYASPDNIREQFQYLSLLMPHLYELMHLNPERMSNTLLEVIKEKYNDYKKNPKQYPSLEVLIYFKLVSNMCSTSDFRHPLATPSYIFMQHILSKAKPKSRQDIAMGLFLVNLSLEFGQISKRFLSAAFNFLLGVIFLSIPKRPVEIYKILPPFQNQGAFSKLLAIAEDSKECKDIKEEPLKAEDLVIQTISDDFKVRSLNQTLKIIQDAINVVSENVGANYLASSFFEMCEKLPLQAYPDYVMENMNITKSLLQIVSSKPLNKLVPPEKKPKALRLLEPRFEAVYDDKRRPKMTKEKEEKAKLLHKIKRETKGALREIRRDTEFIQKIRIKEQIQSDRERHEKVKRIYAEASVQQGELNEMDRAKKKKKKF